MSMLEIIASQQKPSGGYLMQSAGQGPKQIAAPTFQMPTFEEFGDEPTVMIRTDTSTNSAANFVNALKGLG